MILIIFQQVVNLNFHQQQYEEFEDLKEQLKRKKLEMGS